MMTSAWNISTDDGRTYRVTYQIAGNDRLLTVELVIRPGQYNEDTQRRATFKGDTAQRFQDAYHNPGPFLRNLALLGYVDPDHDLMLATPAGWGMVEGGATTPEGAGRGHVTPSSLLLDQILDSFREFEKEYVKVHRTDIRD